MTLPASLTGPANEIAKALIARNETIAVAESSAGGLISAALLSVAGASAYYIGGTVIYTLAASKALIAGAAELPRDVRGASDPFARYLARAISNKIGTTWGLSETGATGPTGNRYGDPAGHAWVGVARANGPDAAAQVLTGSADREANMEAFAQAALQLLLTQLTS